MDASSDLILLLLLFPHFRLFSYSESVVLVLKLCAIIDQLCHKRICAFKCFEKEFHLAITIDHYFVTLGIGSEAGTIKSRVVFHFDR